MNRIKYQLTIAFVVLVGFIGTVSANSGICPDSTAIFPAAGYGTVTGNVHGLGNPPSVTYTVSATSSSPIIGLCVYETSGTVESGIDGFWKFSPENGNPFAFEVDGPGFQTDMTTSNSPQNVGVGNFASGQSISGENYALHLNDANMCTGLNGQSTCWVRPGLGASEQITDLTNYVASNNLGPGTSLLSKLKNAKNLVDSGKTAATCGVLKALINEAQAQSGKKLTPDQAKNIIDAATNIRTTLGC